MPRVRVAGSLKPGEEKLLATVEAWLDSLTEMLAVSSRITDPEAAAKAEVPDWVRKVSLLLEGSIYAPITSNLSVMEFDPFRVGFALGALKWTRLNLRKRVAEGVPKLKSRIRLSPRANRKLGKLLEHFVFKNDLGPLFFKPAGKYFPPEIKWVEHRIKKWGAVEEAEFHRGFSVGIRGLGKDAPGDRSNDATDIHLALLLFWRSVAAMNSVTQLHAWLVRIFGEQLTGERARVATICRRIGLRYRGRGRPRKNTSPVLRG